MLTFLETFFGTYGYLAVFFILILCGFGLPIPEDVTLVAGGVISGLGQANLYIMILVGFSGVLIGDGLMFTAGYFFGPNIVKWRWMNVLTPRRYVKVRRKFLRYGTGVIFTARFLPGLRTPIYVIAGMSHKISYLKFFLLDGLAALISVPIWVFVGHYCASNKELLLTILSNFKLILTIILTALVIYLIIRWRKKKAQKNGGV